MGIIILLFLSVVSSSVARDFSRFTPLYNEYMFDDIATKVYAYCGKISQDTSYANKVKITLDIFQIIDSYGCTKKLLIINRALVIKVVNNKIKFILIRVYVVNDKKLVDSLDLIFDIDRAKRKAPLRRKSNMKTG